MGVYNLSLKRKKDDWMRSFKFRVGDKIKGKSTSHIAVEEIIDICYRHNCYNYKFKSGGDVISTKYVDEKYVLFERK